MVQYPMILGMDIGGTHIRSGFVGPDAVLERFTVCKTGDVLGDARDLVAYLGTLLEGAEKPQAVSVGVPSCVYRDNRLIISTPNIPNFDNVPLADMVEEAWGIPCFVSRDVCLLLLYDIAEQRLDTRGFVLGFYIGTGIGNSIAYNGELITGSHGVAAELGHIPVLGRTEPCGCGLFGCLETWAAGKYLAKIREEQYPGESFADLFTRHGDESAIVEFIDNMATAIALEVNLLDPEQIILGGGVILQDVFPRQRLEAAVRRFARKPYPSETLVFRYSRESQENGVIGAGIFAYQKLDLRSLPSLKI